jgi:hypothetical protein
MSEERDPRGPQGRWQHAACASNVQPTMYGKGGRSAEQIRATFTTPEALAIVGLRLKGENLVRN